MSWRVLLRGAVQGQGVRPALARLARQQGWSGSVRNTSRGVELTLAAEDIVSDEISRLILESLPQPPTSIEISSSQAEIQPGFQVISSRDDTVLTAEIPRDRAVCETCQTEFRDPLDRRHRFGLVSCVDCGPRYSILTSMPYDRTRTTLVDFPLCCDCTREYGDLADRRGHAQTIGCPHCGPQIWASDQDGRHLAWGDEAVTAAAAILLRGGCLALRGIGGYQLLVEATNASAVRRLRAGKHRPTKPLAVMVATLEQAESLAKFDCLSRSEFRSPANPIVLVPQDAATPIAAEVNPGVRDLGLMRPTTAVHARLLELVDRPLVCTSGNLDGDPLAVTVAEAERQLSSLVELYLHHERPIAQPVDDSVVRVMAGRSVTLRCARGLAPLTLALDAPRSIVAVGGHQKAACALSNSAQAVLLPHVGDLNSAGARDRWCARLAASQEVFSVDNPLWTGDAHPDYFSSRWYGEQPGSQVACWHHHAHVVAGMLEHGWLDREVLGVAWDGAGYGTDGTIWGGEFLHATVTGFKRLASLRSFSLIGGDLAVNEISRIAVSLLSQLPELSDDEIARWLRLDAATVRHWRQVAGSRACPRSTSVGRLFDGVAALVLSQGHVDHEGAAAMALESVSRTDIADSYAWRGIDPSASELDWRPLLRGVLFDLRRGLDTSIISGRFHRSLVRLIRSVCHRMPHLPVILGGGVFQNRVLIEMLVEEWTSTDPPLGLPGRIPPNDGGLAAGQLAIAAALCRQEERVPCA